VKYKGILNFTDLLPHAPVLSMLLDADKLGKYSSLLISGAALLLVRGPENKTTSLLGNCNDAAVNTGSSNKQGTY
jgi:hypothetical protein